MYFGAVADSQATTGNYACGNVFEWWAGFSDGRYTNCLGGSNAFTLSAAAGCGGQLAADDPTRQ